LRRVLSYPYRTSTAFLSEAGDVIQAVCRPARAAYYGAGAGGAPPRRAAPPPRTRHRVEDADLRRLAGVEPYPDPTAASPAGARAAAAAGGGPARPALLHMSAAELQALLERA